MRKDLRIVLAYEDLKLLSSTIELFEEEECVGETLYTLHSILLVMAERINKRLAGKRMERYRLTLALHEAIALRRAALVGIELCGGLSVANPLRQVVLAIDPLLPVNCKPY